jgi:hypothetical protein
MSKPTFLGLLNSIAVNERKGEQLLRCWAAHTQDPALAATLNFVAIREGEHAAAFEKRMCELGFAVSEERARTVFRDFDGLLACAASNASDAEKVARLAGRRDAEDTFASFFNDTSIDPLTGELLGRYISEERDSGRRLRAEYDRVTAAAGSDNTASELAELRACVDALQRELRELRGLRSVA